MRYRLRPAVLQADLDAEEVLLNPATGQYHLLNATGRQIVDAFHRGLDTDDVAAEVAEQARLPVSEVRADVETFVTALLSRDLLEAAD